MYPLAMSIYSLHCIYLIFVVVHPIFACHMQWSEKAFNSSRSHTCLFCIQAKSYFFLMSCVSIMSIQKTMQNASVYVTSSALCQYSSGEVFCDDGFSAIKLCDNDLLWH